VFSSTAKLRRREFSAALLLGGFWTRLAAGEELDSPQQVLESIPAIYGDDYRTEDLVKVVNYLRSLGKEKAIHELREFVKRTNSKGDGKRNGVFLVCRCLFANPEGWVPPNIGREFPPLADESIEKWPYFPLAFSDGVPFLITQGYSLGGRGEQSERLLDACGKLQLVRKDLPTTGYDEAVRTLIKDAKFSETFPEDETRKRVSAMLLKQAERKL